MNDNDIREKVMEAYNRLPMVIKVAISVSEVIALMGIAMLLNGATDGLLTFSIGFSLTAMAMVVIIDEMIKGE